MMGALETSIDELKVETELREILGTTQRGHVDAGGALRAAAPVTRGAS